MAEHELTKLSKGEVFDHLLLDAIDEGLSSLGESAKYSIYFHLKNRFKIEKREIPSRLNDFSAATAQIFGLGAQALEILFMKNLYARVKVATNGFAHNWSLRAEIVPKMTFQEYVRFMRQNFFAENENTLEMR